MVSTETIREDLLHFHYNKYPNLSASALTFSAFFSVKMEIVSFSQSWVLVTLDTYIFSSSQCCSFRYSICLQHIIKLSFSAYYSCQCTNIHQYFPLKKNALLLCCLTPSIIINLYIQRFYMHAYTRTLFFY